MKIIVFWHMTLCRLLYHYEAFGRNNCLHVHVRTIRRQSIFIVDP
jgi:hypothetical protein